MHGTAGDRAGRATGAPRLRGVPAPKEKGTVGEVHPANRIAQVGKGVSKGGVAPLGLLS